MIFQRPPYDDPIDQGDIIDGCPIVAVADFDLDHLDSLQTRHTLQRVIVLTQTCDLAHRKATRVVTAVILDAQSLVAHQILKPADIRGPIRAGRVYGWYFLPKAEEFGLAESIVDLRQLHTIRLDLVHGLCRRGQRLARLQPLYREHLAQHFADTYSRIGLPQAYETK